MYCWEVEEDNSTGNKWEMSLFDTDTFSGGVKLLCTVKRPFVVFALWHLNIWTVKSLEAFLLKQVSTVHKPGNCLQNSRERENAGCSTFHNGPTTYQGRRIVIHGAILYLIKEAIGEHLVDSVNVYWAGQDSMGPVGESNNASKLGSIVPQVPTIHPWVPVGTHQPTI